MAPVTEIMIASGNLAQCWGEEVVPEVGVHQVQNPRSCKLSMASWFGSRHTAQVWLLSELSQPQHSRYQQLDATHGPSNNAEEKRPSKGTGYSPQRCQVPPSHMYKLLLFWSVSGWPSGVFWSGNIFFLFAFFFSSSK